MKKTFTTTRIIAVTLMALLVSAAQARAAVTVYADDIPSNGVVAASAPNVQTNAPAAQTNLGAKSGSSGENPDVQIDGTGIHIGGPDGINVGTSRGMTGLATTLKLLIPILGIICPFGMVVAIIALAGYFGHRRNKMAHETMRAMIDKGVPMTPELVAEIRSKRLSGGGLNPQRGSRLFPGLVLVGIGAALLLAGHGETKGGLIVLFIGLAFLVVWAVEHKNPNNPQPPLR